jgi:ferric-dicitrate binding protein FerR (iron transport regulator)
MDEMNIDNPKGLIVKFLEGELSLEEEKKLYEWIKANPENEVLFIQYRDIWLASSVKAKSYSANTQEAFHKIESAISVSGKTIQVHSRWKIGYFVKVAAILILVFLTGIFTSQLLLSKKVIGGKLCEVVTPLGSRTFIVLPDGSQVWLNAGSKLTYDNSFGENDRKVKLTGEAFFKVKTNKKKPFIVSTRQMNVRAYGTSFNVKAYPDDKVISTTLVEGIVKVDGVEGKKKFAYTLQPSQNITIQNNIPEETKLVERKKFKAVVKQEVLQEESKTEVVKEVKTELYTSWKDPRWNIEGESLSSLAVLLERRFNTKIYITNDQLSVYKFTGIIQNETLEQVLQFLSFTTPIEYKIGKGEIWWDIDPKKALQYSKILNNKP